MEEMKEWKALKNEYRVSGRRGETSDIGERDNPLNELEVNLLSIFGSSIERHLEFYISQPC